jgi:hypothetical protein
MHKVRESLMAQRDESPLAGGVQGEVQMDGAFVGGSVRPANRIEDRVDGRVGENQDPDRRCVLLLRTSEPGSEAGAVAKRTLSFILQRENQDDVTRVANRFITAGTRISADESEAYNLLQAQFPPRRVNRSQAYRVEDETNTHQAESFHARLRRMQIGQHHQFRLAYLGKSVRPVSRA